MRRSESVKEIIKNCSEMREEHTGEKMRVT
jgi:hypothetical protein